MWYSGGILSSGRLLAPTVLLLALSSGCLSVPPDPGPALCGAEDAVALYRFDEPEGSSATRVENRGLGTDALDLTIRDPEAVRWLGYGLTVVEPTHLFTEAGTEELLTEIRVSGALAIEAWVKQRNQLYAHTSPARIVSMAAGVQRGDRNFVLGQEEGREDEDPWERIIARVEGDYDLVSEPGPYVRDAPLHLVMTIEADELRLYIDGALEESMEIAPYFQGWSAHPLNVANEYAPELDSQEDRHWIGELYRIGLYPRAMSEEEVACRAGVVPPSG